MHKNAVPKEFKDKVLYTDCLGVKNFITCSKCKKVFDARQREPLHQDLHDQFDYTHLMNRG